MNTDGYAAYNVVNPKGRQSCLAHLIRKAEEIKQEILLKKQNIETKNLYCFVRVFQTYYVKLVKSHINSTVEKSIVVVQKYSNIIFILLLIRCVLECLPMKNRIH